MSDEINKRTLCDPAPDRRASDPAPRDFEPVRMMEMDLGRPLSLFPPHDDQTGRSYRRARILVRLHDWPLGLVDVDLEDSGVSGDACASLVWQALGAEIRDHLASDGIPVGNDRHLARAAADPAVPRCHVPRERALADAPEVSIVIPTHERTADLEQTLHSIFELEYPKSRFQVIAVDNCPRTSATRDMIVRAFGDGDRVRYLREDLPGPSNARNRGLRVAEGEIVAFTDDDALVDRHWLAELAAGFAVTEDVGAVTGLVVPMELETPAQLWFEQFGGFSKSGFRQQVYSLKRHRPANPLFPYSTGLYGSGNNMAFRRSTLLQIGHFDPALGAKTPALNGEDPELLLRAIIQGRTLVYRPAAIVHHKHRRQYAELRAQLYSYGVGFTAVLTKTLLTHPHLLPDFLGKLPRGVLFALSPHSGANSHKRRDYPAELNSLHLRGMLLGPVAYLRSRRYASHLLRSTKSGERPAV